MGDNHVTIIGNVTRRPELVELQGPGRVTTFGVAIDRRRQDPTTKEWIEAVSFFDVTCWGELAQHVADSLDKGTRVIVTGRLEQRSWESTSGEKRSKVEVVAEDVAPSLRWATATVAKVERKSVPSSSLRPVATSTTRPTASSGPRWTTT